jgi:alpha-L-rhamnosidase
MPTEIILTVLLAVYLAISCFAQTSTVAAGLSAPRNLRCEYLPDPLGIDRPRPRLSWEMVDPRRGATQRAYQILVADDPAALARDAGNLWDSGKVASDQSIQVEYAGRPLRSRMQVWWKLRLWDWQDQPSPWSRPAHWSMGLLEAADWQARWIGGPADTPPLLRRIFVVPPDAGPVRRATVHVTALGLYELRLNGQRVGDHVLAPEWTDYHKRVQYQTYDVTDLLRPGQNVIGALLGDGWYAGRIGLTQIVPGGPARGIYGPQPLLLLQLEIELSDGRVQTVVSDRDWRVTAEGPIRAADLLDGEVYDARREMPGWDLPGFDDAAWQPAIVFDPPPARLVAQPNQPIRVVQEVKPVGLTEPQPGVYIFDLGQNLAGWCRLKLRGPAGTTVMLRHAEVLNPDGTLYTANLRSAAQTDRYTLRGEEREVFEPHFTYHGFRYVEVTLDTPRPALRAGSPGEPRALPGAACQGPALDDLVGCVLSSSCPQTGHFECSNPLLNKLMENILWTQRANLMSVPTDCPQRDERLGWMGDILVFAQTACFNLDMAAFLAKWVPDVRDAQAPDGRYPDFAPHPFDPATRFSGAPGWADAGVFVPWCVHVNYADRRMLEEHFESARGWVEHVRGANPDLLWKTGRGNDYGDWLNADTLKLEGWPSSGAAVPKEVLATAFFARSTHLLSKMAAAVGRDDDADRYAKLADEIKAAFNRAYVAPDGRIEGDTQGGYALALHFDLLPEELRAPAAGHMLKAFETYRGHISTGFHSSICLMQELTRQGYNDQAYRLIQNRTLPSWGYAIDHGATTIWERWDGLVEGRGFQEPGMNSFSHYALGAVGEWMYRVIAGINPDEQSPGYKHFIIRPRPGGGLSWAKGGYDSIHGRIVSRWGWDQAPASAPGGTSAGGQFTLEIEIPANTSATVYLPASDPGEVFEGDRPAEQAEAVELVGKDDGAVAYRVGSGSYRFVVRAAAPDNQLAP